MAILSVSAYADNRWKGWKGIRTNSFWLKHQYLVSTYELWISSFYSLLFFVLFFFLNEIDDFCVHKDKCLQ